MGAHSSVIYVEPNMEPIKDGWAVEDTFERAPRLEDYCIAMNIEVEVCSRDKVGTMSQELSEVLIMQWRNDNNGQKDYVNFMGGTKIGEYDIDGVKRTPRLNNTYDALTTYYADMYVGDLIDYGTTEMVGIKSVNIEYERSCVPIISIVFTDVRGMSIFQPQEIARDNTYNGIKGINKHNVAQSFFQCFFKMPLPKFTIYIKGFYGKPVAYEVMCDKFDTNFNSDTGDFEVSTRFIGYAYSFLTDVSMDALIAAPYSDYRGADYWNEKVESGEFYVLDKTGKHHKKMPTLTEIVTRYNELSVTGKSEDEATTVTYEESNHEIELKELKDIHDNAYTKWYDNLYSYLSALFNKEGEQRCFDFRETGTDSDYMYLLLLTDKSGPDNLSGIYRDSLQGFHELNNNVYNIIKTYNEKENKFKELENVSIDFTDYRKIRIFQEISSKVVDVRDGKAISREGKLDFVHNLPDYLKNDILQRLFYYTNPSSGGNESNESIFDTTVNTIKQKGDTDKQLLYGYVIKVDYSSVKDRINGLTAEMNKSAEQKSQEKRLKEINEKLMARMDFYPSIENFTRIMMAHFETFMDMMYGLANDIIEERRTPDTLGITVGDDGNVQDTNENDKYIPPFPRITRKVIGDDNITRNEDAWVGSFNDGKGFKEVDIIDGLFNGMDEVFKLVADSNTVLEDNNKGVEKKVPNCEVPCPLSSYDFFIHTSPYGSDDETLNNLDAFIGRIAIRMFDLLSVSSFRLGGVLPKIPDVKKIAKIEAINFNKTSVMNNTTLVNALGHDENSTMFKIGKIEKLLFENVSLYTDGKSVPWATKDGKRTVFNHESLTKNGIWMDLYSSKRENSSQWYYPIQGGTFAELESDFNMFIDPKKNNINGNSTNVDNFSVRKMKLSGQDFKTFMSSNSFAAKTGLNTVFFSDDHRYVLNIVEKSAPDSTEEADYSSIYSSITSHVAIPGPDVNPFITDDNVITEASGIKKSSMGKTRDFGDVGKGNLFVKYVTKNSQMIASVSKGADKTFTYSNPINGYYEVADKSAFGNLTITEMRGIDRSNNSKYSLARDRSLLADSTKNELAALDETRKTAFAIETVEGVDYVMVRKELEDKSFIYLPRLAVLQIGAAIYVDGQKNPTRVGDSEYEFTDIDKEIPLADSAKTNVKHRMTMSSIIYSMSPLARFAYAKYFKDWSDSDEGKNFRSILQNMADPENGVYLAKYGDKRRLLNENSQSIRRLTDNLLSMVLITKGCVSYNVNATSANERITFEKKWIGEYFSAFFDKLRVLHGFKQEDIIDDNGVLKQAAPAKKTTEDMKIELYRYLKLLYDKWIPTNPQASWNMKTFFNDGKSEDTKALNGGGHTFHFIDSYYNKLGNKLLLNVGKLAGRVMQLLNSNDVSVMMLGFMADIYSDNKCMMLCIQNFADMSDKNSMRQMFKPIPYNEMPSPNKHPDFVVVYPYEPSKNLDINNAEFKDDGFMLNDETLTPIAIKSRGDNEDSWYRIPAFGVSYGKQYQNYFKKVNVNMSSPIATQQSIMAKHTILKMSNGDSTKGTQGQDMYDVYSTQSYTCTVEMMGCAWIQPMMYFVLTNVPMFKGSYMIMRVTHSITPGNMTTTFTGCRMSRNSNRLVENVFTDDLDGNSSSSGIDSKRERFADVDNDCGYKVYNLFETSDTELSGDAEKDGLAIMRKLISLGYNEYAAAGIVGNMYIESYDYKNTKKRFKYDLVVEDNSSSTKGTSGGLCMWRNGALDDLVAGKTSGLGHNKKVIAYSEAVRQAYSNKLNSLGIDKQLAYLKNTMTAGGGNYAPLTVNDYNSFCASNKSPRSCAAKFEEKYERPANINPKRGDAAEEFYKAYKNTGGGTTTIKKVEPARATKKDIYAEFMRCLQLSVNSTDNGKVPLLYSEGRNGRGEYLRITQKGGSDKLPLVFDIILDGYYDYVRELWWVYENENTIKSDPICIDVILELNVDTNNRQVYIVDGAGKHYGTQYVKGADDFNTFNIKFLKSLLGKFHKSFDGTDLPQFPTFTQLVDNSNLFIADCEDAMKTVYVSGDKSTWAKSVQSMGKWYEANVHEYSQKAMIACDLLGGEKVRKDCSGYVSACLQYFGAFKKGYNPSSTEFVSGGNLAGMLNNAGFRKMPYSWDKVEPYDIIAYIGHVEILAEKGEHPKSWGWGKTHDCRNGHACMPVGTGNEPKGNTYTTIWRYVGSGKG